MSLKNLKKALKEENKTFSDVYSINKRQKILEAVINKKDKGEYKNEYSNK